MSNLFPILWGYRIDDEIRELRAAGVTHIPIGIPWDMIAPHDAQAQTNHSQSLKRLAERGGLGPDEAVAVILGRRHRRMTKDGAVNQLNTLVLDWTQSAAAAHGPDEPDFKAENERLRTLLNTPHNEDWFEGVRIEAAHQVERWGVDYDRGKAPSDWFWLIGFLAGKALQAAMSSDIEKAKHHTISTGAVLLNWFGRLRGTETRFQPGVDSLHGNAAPRDPREAK